MDVFESEEQFIIWASVHRFTMLLKELEFKSACAISSIKASKDLTEVERITKIQDMMEYAKYAIKMKYDISNMPGYKWWLYTVSYDKKRVWRVPKSIYDVLPCSVKTNPKHHGRRSVMKDRALDMNGAGIVRGWKHHSGWYWLEDECEL